MVEKIRRPSIVWQKWNDPLMSSDSIYTSPEDFIQEPNFIDDINEPNELEDTSDVEYQEDHNTPKKYVKALITPLGIIPYDDHNSIGSIFNFWMGHTNFDLTPKIVSIIENSEGVELLDVYTRYRFRVGIGQLFNSGDVMSAINTNVYRCLDDGDE